MNQQKSNAYAIVQVETSLIDGWYFIEEMARDSLEFWTGIFPNNTHWLVSYEQVSEHTKQRMAQLDDSVFLT